MKKKMVLTVVLAMAFIMMGTVVAFAQNCDYDTSCTSRGSSSGSAYSSDYGLYNPVWIGNSYASGYNNTVFLYGLNNGTCTYVEALCLRGYWWVDPCNWDSYCSTGWSFASYPVNSSYCSGCGN